MSLSSFDGPRTCVVRPVAKAGKVVVWRPGARIQVNRRSRAGNLLTPMNRIDHAVGNSASDAGRGIFVARRRSVRIRQAFVLAAGFVVGALAWVEREPLRQWVFERSVLNREAPAAESVRAVILDSRSPERALLAAWDSHRVVPREVAVRLVREVVGPGARLSSAMERVVLGGALDADLAVRQAALGTLQEVRHPAYPALAAAQVRDVDPEVRVLGLNHLRAVPAEAGMPALIALLNDPDPLVLTMALKLLEKWGGGDFGVALREVVRSGAGATEDRGGGIEKARAGAEKARRWWREHEAEFTGALLELPPAAMEARGFIPAPDFALPDLAGRTVRLGDFRGKVLLLNFWTTWCTACVAEMPALVQLQRRHADRVAVVGISLDFVPDSHGHRGSHQTTGEAEGDHEEPSPHAAGEHEFERIRQKVIRTVRAQGIDYPILLDEGNEAGARYNGGELPTTVIIDAQGRIRRRFIGGRRLEVFESMIEEAARAPGSAALGP